MANVNLSAKRKKRNVWTAKNLAAEYPAYVKLLDELSRTKLEEFLKMKRERFSENYIDLLKDNSETDSDAKNTYPFIQHTTENIVNALCHPDVVNKVTELLLS